MSSNLLGFAKELAQTKPNDLPEKFLHLERKLNVKKSFFFRFVFFLFKVYLKDQRHRPVLNMMLSHLKFCPFSY